jgi:N-acetylglucosamine kinase-like BadF-type ATPase
MGLQGGIMETDDFVLGVDGGGSKTRVTLFRRTRDGLHAVAHSQGKSSNATVEDFEGISAELEYTLKHLCWEQAVRLEHVAALGLGMAGAGRPSVTRAWEEWAYHRYPATRIWVGSDLDLVLPDPQDGQTTVVLVAGTGSIAAMRDASGTLHRTGGWGPILGDEGGGYWMAVQAFRAVCQAMDYDEPPSALRYEAETFLGVESWREAPAAIRLLSRAEIARFAEVVIRCSQGGEPRSKGVVQQTVSHWIKMLTTLGGKVGSEAVVLRLAGGLLVGNEELRKQLFVALTQSGLWSEIVVEVFEEVTEVAATRAIKQGRSQRHG